MSAWLYVMIWSLNILEPLPCGYCRRPERDAPAMGLVRVGGSVLGGAVTELRLPAEVRTAVVVVTAGVVPVSADARPLHGAGEWQPARRAHTLASVRYRSISH
jgi:hypothetical protein